MKKHEKRACCFLLIMGPTRCFMMFPCFKLEELAGIADISVRNGFVRKARVFLVFCGI